MSSLRVDEFIDKFITVRLLLFILFVGWGYCLWPGLKWFRVEEKVHKAYSPVVWALYDYEEDNGVRAPSLQALIPRYIESLPSLPFVISEEYSLRDRGDWQFDVRVRLCGEVRVFRSRGSNSYSEQDDCEYLGNLHGVWFVLKEQSVRGGTGGVTGRFKSRN